MRILRICGAAVLAMIFFFGFANLFHLDTIPAKAWVREEISKIRQYVIPVKETPKDLSIYEAYQDQIQTKITGKTEVPCPQQTDKTVVLLIIGQSNAGNHAEHKFTSTYKSQIVNYFNGKCFVAASPLVGSSGLGGESWTLLGNLLVAAGAAENVVLVPAAVGGSFISSWRADGNLNRMLVDRLGEVKRKYSITQILWHQGESDFR